MKTKVKATTKVLLVALLTGVLSGCFLTKVVTVPMRLIGAAGNVVGAAVSIIPVVGNTANSAIYKADGAINDVADNIDKVPI
jgi:hypothetical protein